MKFTIRATVSLALVIASLSLVLAACGSSSESTSDQAQPLAADTPGLVDDTSSIELVWNEGDDAAAITSDWENQGLSFDVEDTDGNTVSTTEVDGCFMDSVDTTSATPDEYFSVTVDCAQRDWEAREGSAWDDFATAYADGYETGCEAVFDLSPEGSLYVDDWEYTSLDCDLGSEYDAELSAQLPADVPDSPSVAGEAAGAYDGCVNLFDNVGGPLYYGSDSIDEGICDSGGSASSAEAGVVVDQTDAIGFQSPSGNIRCLYDAITDAVSCHVKNLGKTVSLDSNGKAFDVGNTEISNQSQVVQYGSVWKRSVFTCESSTNGFLCAANVGNYGGYFAVSREGTKIQSD